MKVTVPLFGGPHDGSTVEIPFQTETIKVPFRPGLTADGIRVRHHIYHLSKDGKRYVHTTLLGAIV